MPTPAMTTRLEAVNTILTASGEQSVSSLSNSTADVANAELVLDEVSRSVQSEDWHFNSDEDVPLAPNETGAIIVPANTISLDVKKGAHPRMDIVQRGTRLYDRLNRTYTFTAPIVADISYYLPWDDLTEPARYYIAVRAARIFHDRFVGSDTVHKFTEEDELRARMNLKRSDLANADINLFAGSGFFAALRRR